MNLSEHFTLAEAIKSQTATRLRIDNSPPADVVARMVATAEAILEPLRAHFSEESGREIPVTINSFYRCLALNRAIKSKDNSQHVTGEAVDFEVPGYDNDEVAAWVRDNLAFDQCIREFAIAGDPSSGWVHVSFKPAGCRGECLTINEQGTFEGLVA